MATVGDKRKLPENSLTRNTADKPKISMSLSGSPQKRPVGVSLKLVSYFRVYRLLVHALFPGITFVRSGLCVNVEIKIDISFL